MALPTEGPSDEAAQVPPGPVPLPVDDLVVEEDVGRVHPLRQLLRVIASNGKRLAFLVVGSVLVLGGVALLVLPGPGILVIIAGLAVLAREFVWAERLLDRAKAHANTAKNAAGGALRRRRRSRDDDAPS